MNDINLKVHDYVVRSLHGNEAENIEVVRILAEIIINDLIKKILASNSSNMNNINEVIENYGSGIISEILYYKDIYISFSNIKSYIEQYHITSTSDLSDDDIKTIIKMYNQKIEIESFRMNKFSQYMYSVIEDLTLTQYERAVFIHQNVMVPIIEYYVQEMGIDEGDMIIHSASGVQGNPMKEIVFSIKGIRPQDIFTNINRNRIFIKEYIYKMTFSGSYVTLLLK